MIFQHHWNDNEQWSNIHTERWYFHTTEVTRNTGEVQFEHLPQKKMPLLKVWFNKVLAISLFIPGLF